MQKKHHDKILHARLEQICKIYRPSRRDGWIGAVRERTNGVSRALTDIWEAFSGNVKILGGRFVKIFENEKIMEINTVFI